MRILTIALALLSGTLLAQTTPAPGRPDGSAPVNGPSYADLNCSGFLSHKPLSRAIYLLGSKESPDEGYFDAHEEIFFRGTGLVPEQRYRLVREVVDPNREDPVFELRTKLAALGASYQDIGWVTVRSVHADAVVATFDYACTTAAPGDFLIPFEERTAPAMRPFDLPMRSFKVYDGTPYGRILGAKDFDEALGTGQVVYTDLGATKGVHPGSYLMVEHGYAADDLNRIDRASTKLPFGNMEASNPAVVTPEDFKRLPRRVVGEILVLWVTPDASIGYISRSLTEMQPGDMVQAEDGQLTAPVEAPAAAAKSRPCVQRSSVGRMLHMGHGCKPTDKKHERAAD